MLDGQARNCFLALASEMLLGRRDRQYLLRGTSNVIQILQCKSAVIDLCLGWGVIDDICVFLVCIYT